MIAVLCALSHASTATSQVIQYVQDFDATTAPVLPAGWSSPDSTWETSTSVASPGSGANNAENAGNAPGSLVSPVFDFSAASTASLSYLARRTSTYDTLNLHLEASVDGGATWPLVLLDSTAALPEAASTYETISVSLADVVGESAVRLRFRARKATGGNVRLDDVTIEADGAISSNRFGFAAGSSHAVESSGGVVVPIALRLIPSSDSLQGLQFVVSLSSGLTFVSFDIGLASLNSPDWQFSYEPTGSAVNVVVLAQGSGGLPPVDTDSLFLLTVETLPLAGALERTDTLSIDGVIASATSADGDDLFLALDPARHLLTVSPRQPNLILNPDTVDVGILAPDSTAQTSFTVANSGTGSLEIFDMFSITGLAIIAPAFATIEPDSTLEITIEVDASLYGLGLLQDWIVIEHDGSTSPDTVVVTGLVASTLMRGDANGDGVVDIVDLVTGVDLILGRVTLPETRDRLDLHPFPEGNGGVDVRDLTVLAHAIARGIWPDGSSLPPAAQALAKKYPVVGNLIVNRTDRGLGLWIRSFAPLRAIHVIARIAPTAEVIPFEELPAVHIGRPYGRQGPDSFSILAFGVESNPVPSGDPIFLAEIVCESFDDIEIISIVAVADGRSRRTLVPVRESSETSQEALESVFGQPYPNPVDGEDRSIVHLPLIMETTQSIDFAITDILGRTVTTWVYEARSGIRVAAWDLRNSHGRLVPPGLYFVTAQLPERRQTRTLTVY